MADLADYLSFLFEPKKSVYLCYDKVAFMEKKKVPNADLEKDKTLFLLMSLIVVLSLVFVGLEWQYTGNRIGKLGLFEEDADFLFSEEEYELPDRELLNEYPESELPEPVILPEFYEGFRESEDSTDLLENIVVPEIVLPDQQELMAELPDHLKVEVQDDEIYTQPDSMPEFPGGLQALIRYVYNAIIYPEEARKLRIQGRVISSFIINANGSISEVKIEQGVNPLLDEEAIRVLNTMPDWKPGKQAGRSVRVKYILPISFRL